MESSKQKTIIKEHGDIIIVAVLSIIAIVIIDILLLIDNWPIDSILPFDWKKTVIFIILNCVGYIICFIIFSIIFFIIELVIAIDRFPDKVLKIDALAEAELELARLYLDVESPVNDPSQGIRWLERAAEHGNGSALYELGQRYYCGNDVEENRPKALAYMEAALARGHVEAKDELSFWHYKAAYDDDRAAIYQSRGVYKDIRRLGFISLRVNNMDYDKAKERLGEAYCEVGRRYLSGNRVERDLDEAVNWLDKAAESGNTEAITFLRETAKCGHTKARTVCAKYYVPVYDHELYVDEESTDDIESAVGSEPGSGAFDESDDIL